MFKIKKLYAFTLIEMLIVLAIITTLVLLFIPNITKKGEEANNQSKTALQQVINNQATLYYYDKGEQPKEIKDLVPDYLTEAQKNKADEYGLKIQ